MGPVDKDWTTRGTTSSQLILHEMVMTGNVQTKFPMEHNTCWLQGMRNEKNYDNTRQHKPKNEQNNGGTLATAPDRGTRSVKRNIGLS